MSSQQGGCFCDKIRISYTGAPAMHVLCHCLDCRKMSGAMYSNNIVVPAPSFNLVSGTPKIISKIADSGKEITSFFCADCGTTLYRKGDSFPGQVIIKSGILDDPKWVNENQPKGELFAGSRAEWMEPIEGAAQLS